jgi:hypothetical protein
MNYFTNFPASNFMTEFEIVEIDNEIKRIKDEARRHHEENNIMANQVIHQILQFDFHANAGLIPGPGSPLSSASEEEEEDSEEDTVIEEEESEDETEIEEEEEEEDEEKDEEEDEEVEEEEEEWQFNTPLPHPLEKDNRPEENPIAFQLADAMKAPVDNYNSDTSTNSSNAFCSFWKYFRIIIHRF